MIEAGRCPPGIPYRWNADPAARFRERMATFDPALALARADESTG
jgi:hypothetical protein